MKLYILSMLFLGICLGLNIDNINGSYYLGQIDKYENFKICFDSNKYSGFFVINISKDIKFLKDKNCLYVYSLKNSRYGKKFIQIKFIRCLDPFDYDLCDAFGEYQKKINFIFDLKRSYKINVFYNQTGEIYRKQTIIIKINKSSLGKSYFDIKNVKIIPKKYEYYDIKKYQNTFKIEFYSIIEDKYKISFDIVRNNFEKTHLSLNVTIKPTVKGKIRNIKKGVLMIPSYLQGFYSLISLFI